MRRSLQFQDDSQVLDRFPRLPGNLEPPAPPPTRVPPSLVWPWPTSQGSGRLAIDGPPAPSGSQDQKGRFKLGADAPFKDLHEGRIGRRGPRRGPVGPEGGQGPREAWADSAPPARDRRGTPARGGLGFKPSAQT